MLKKRSERPDSDCTVEDGADIQKDVLRIVQAGYALHGSKCGVERPDIFLALVFALKFE
jgi:hypothetical protein